MWGLGVGDSECVDFGLEDFGDAGISALETRVLGIVTCYYFPKHVWMVISHCKI